MLVLAICAATSLPASAAESADMRVGGAVTMQSGCTLSLSEGGAISYGDIPFESLAPSGVTLLPARSIDADVSCAAPTRIALSIADNRDGTASATTMSDFGLGVTSHAKKIGRFEVTISSGDHEGVPGRVIVATGSMTDTYASYAGAPIHKRNSGQSQFFSVLASSSSASAPEVLQNAAFLLRFSGEIAPKSSLSPLGGPQAIDGNATVEIHYL